MESFTTSRLILQISAGISALVAGFFTITCPCGILGSCHIQYILPGLLYALAVILYSNYF